MFRACFVWHSCLLLVLVAGLLSATGCATGRGGGAGERAVAPSDEPLQWLSGNWRCVNEAGVWEEHWFAPVGGAMVGSLRWTRVDGTVALVELFSVERAALEPGGAERWVLFLRHFGAGLEPWAREREATPRYAVERMDDEQLVAHSFPDQLTMIRYQRVAGDGGGITAEVLSREGAQDAWSRQVFLAFERQ